jgi:FixJ family two-component response regulator
MRHGQLSRALIRHQGVHCHIARQPIAPVDRRTVQEPLMALVVSGPLNKQVGSELGISEISLKARREPTMQKMKTARSESFGVDRPLG